MKEATSAQATRRARRAVERESDCVLDRHGRKGWSQEGRMLGCDAHGCSFVAVLSLAMRYLSRHIDSDSYKDIDIEILVVECPEGRQKYGIMFRSGLSEYP